MNKKKWILPVLIAVLVVVALAVAAWLLWPRDTAQTGSALSDYNTTATVLAQRDSKIGEREILIAESTKKEDDGNLTVTFRVFSVAEGYTPSYFMTMSIADARKNPGLTDMGYATASFLKGQPEGVFGLTVMHER